RHPAGRDALRRLQLLQGDRHVLPARPLDRHARRARRSARPEDGAARERRGAPGVALEPHERDDPGDPLELLRARVLRGRRAVDRHRLRGRRVQERGGAQASLPEAGGRRRGGDREDRRVAQPRDLVAGGARRAGAAAHPSLGRRLMAWARDDAKLDRVRALMAERGLDALVVRAPDNVLYLTNFWGMKGYDACVFPRDGEPVLITIEASADDAAQSAWTEDVRLIQGYAPDDPRPVTARTLEAALEASRDYGRVGLELSMGTQATDRMVGEPTTFTSAWFAAWPDADDAMSVLVPARTIKTPQEVERMRLANEICAAAMEHVRDELRAGMTEAQAAAIWQSFVHGEGTGWRGKVELALPFSLVWSGPGIRTFTATGHREIQPDQPTLFEIWVCADGYWADHTKLLCPGTLRADYREYEAQLLDVYAQAIDHCRPEIGR